MAKRKVVVMVLAVSVPPGMSTAQARREVRTLINDQCNWDAEPGDVKVRRLSAAVQTGARKATKSLETCRNEG